MHADWLAWSWLAKYYSPPSSRRKTKYLFNSCSIFTNLVTLLAASYSACVVYTKTIIHLSVGESGGYLPRSFAAQWISTTIHLHFGESLLIIIVIIIIIIVLLLLYYYYYYYFYQLYFHLSRAIELWYLSFFHAFCYLLRGLSRGVKLCRIFSCTDVAKSIETKFVPVFSAWSHMSHAFKFLTFKRLQKRMQFLNRQSNQLKCRDNNASASY